jgi:hypothetical protein
LVKRQQFAAPHQFITAGPWVQIKKLQTRIPWSGSSRPLNSLEPITGGPVLSLAAFIRMDWPNYISARYVQSVDKCRDRRTRHTARCLCVAPANACNAYGDERSSMQHSTGRVFSPSFARLLQCTGLRSLVILLANASDSI